MVQDPQFLLLDSFLKALCHYSSPEYPNPKKVEVDKWDFEHPFLIYLVMVMDIKLACSLLSSHLVNGRLCNYIVKSFGD